MASKYEKWLPVITGVSEKQIAYAQSLRDNSLNLTHSSLIKVALAIRDGKLTDEVCAEPAARLHQSVEKYKADLISSASRVSEIISFSSASDIIEYLKIR